MKNDCAVIRSKQYKTSLHFIAFKTYWTKNVSIYSILCCKVNKIMPQFQLSLEMSIQYIYFRDIFFLFFCNSLKHTHLWVFKKYCLNKMFILDRFLSIQLYIYFFFCIISFSQCSLYSRCWISHPSVSLRFIMCVLWMHWHLPSPEHP